MEEKKVHWKIAFIWLLVLAPLFFLIYGFGNSYTASLSPEKVGEICFSWEKYIPFIPWTILPYWSIDLLYGLSLFLPMTQFALRQHALRLLTATPVAVLFFYFFPLTFSTPRPETSGVWKYLFDFLMGFDKPYNQAPSLHIILLIIIWQIYRPYCSRLVRWGWGIWCLLIGISVLTTFQHHFIDIPPAIAIGVLLCYLFPLERELQWKWKQLKSRKLVYIYLAGFFLFTCIPLLFHSYGWYIFWWFSLFCLLLSFGYSGLSNVFQKRQNGTFTFAGIIIFFPYRIISRLIRHYFFTSSDEEKEILEGIFLGSSSSAKNTRCLAVLDLCNEYPKQTGSLKKYQNVPVIDLAVISLEELSNSVQILDKLYKENGSVLVHCALGVSRSVSVVLGWLVYSGKVSSLNKALEFLKEKDYPFILSSNHEIRLNEYVKNIKKQ